VGEFEARNFKLEKGINPNPTWTPGRKSKQTLNYLGKTLGDNQTAPHKLYSKSVADIANLTLSDFTDADEVSQFDYDTVGKQNGVLLSKSTNVAGETMCLMAEFDLANNDLSLSNLKDLLRKITVLSVVSGEGDNDGLTYGVTLKGLWGANNDVFPTAGSFVGESTSETIASVSKTPDINSVGNIPTSNQKIYVLIHSTHPAGSNIESTVNIDYLKLDVELSQEVDYIKSNVVKVRKETKEIKMEYPITSHRTGITDSVAIWYEHVPVPQKLESTEDVTVLAEMDHILVSDLSSAVGDKQGTHHWMNPLYRVGNDRLDVFGEFGFANIPLAADSKNVNVGKSIQVNGSGFRDYFITQYGLSALNKPMVGIIGNLVMHENELKLLVVSIYNETGLIDTRQNGVGLLLKIKGNPLVKLDEGERDPAIIPNAWRTQTGEIQGYLDEN
ncbi:hypothetical protein, partial [Chengkuizengella axinellae]